MEQTSKTLDFYRKGIKRFFRNGTLFVNAVNMLSPVVYVKGTDKNGQPKDIQVRCHRETSEEDKERLVKILNRVAKSPLCSELLAMTHDSCTVFSFKNNGYVGMDGCYIPAVKRIYMDRDLDDDRLVAVLSHEIAHPPSLCFLWQYMGSWGYQPPSSCCWS